MAAWVILLILISAAFVLVTRHDVGVVAGVDANDFAMIATAVALFVWAVTSLYPRYRGRMSQALRDLMTWVAILMAFIGVYSYREPLRDVALRLTGELLPAGNPISLENPQIGEKSVRIRRRNQEHFFARAKLNGTDALMLVDTGASAVVLTPSDARNAGVNINRLDYTVPVSTANGTTYAARVKIAKIAIGIITITNVEALVAKPGMLKESLLGMSFLSRLRSYEFSGDFLTLRS